MKAVSHCTSTAFTCVAAVDGLAVRAKQRMKLERGEVGPAVGHHGGTVQQPHRAGQDRAVCQQIFASTNDLEEGEMHSQITRNDFKRPRTLESNGPEYSLSTGRHLSRDVSLRALLVSAV
jgi:hypothetical protein